MTDQPLPDTAFGTASSADPFQAAKASAMKAAENRAQQFRSTAEQKVGEFKERATAKAGEFRDYADQTFTNAKAKYGDLRNEAETFAREKPMQALITAFGVGLFVGLLLRK
jgi:ElaB/YqjD/DUF883 family membrane-anchored ribosome-binding protein